MNFESFAGNPEAKAQLSAAVDGGHFPHALLLEERQLCLEEYVPLLQRGEQVCRLANGRTARVSWLPCPGDTAELPLPDGCWQLSGDNQGGFILTVWEGEP